MRAIAAELCERDGLARLAMCARVFGKKKDGRSICDAAARQRLSIVRNECSTGLRSIDGI